MFQRSKALLVAAVALMTVTATTDADAGRSRLFGHHHHSMRRIVVKTNVHVDNRVAINFLDGRSRHRVRRQVNTYSGDVAISYRAGVGTWSTGTVWAPARSLTLTPNAKIISLRGGRTGCSMEKGVCVIRP